MEQLQEKVGAIHIHTVFSDGSGQYHEVVRAASELGLDYLLFSDHHTLEPKRQNLEGFHDGILVGIGYEINDQDNHNHLLAFDVTREVENGVPPIEYTRRVVEAGGWAVVAHPDERRHKLRDFPPYPWTAWESEDFQAIEIWNQMSEWMERLTRWNKLWLSLNPRRSVLSPTRWILEKWDQLNLKRRVVGIGGVDAHAHHYQLWRNVNVEIFPYKVQFRSVRTHVLLETAAEKEPHEVALKRIYGALRAGRAFVSNRYVGEARGFRFWAEDSESGEKHNMGDRLKRVGNLVFRLSLPRDADSAVILKDNRPVWKYQRNASPYRNSEPGVYRVEVQRRGRAFIYSNPIVVEAE